MSDDVVFQSSTPATPPNATRVATDFVDSRHHQLIKIEFGDNGTAYAVSYGTPLPIGTLPGGTFSVNGTLQVLGSVSIVGTLAGGTVGILGTVQGLGTYQPLAGSVHVANTISGTYQPLAGSVHLASRLPGTVDVGTIAGTVQALGTVAIASVGTLAASLAKREDVTHNDSDVGVMILGVRRDTAATAAANGEYTAISTDSTGRVRVNSGPDLVDSGNSSTTLLAGGATFTGTGIEVTEYSSIVVNAFSDVASATDGLQLQFSQNNTNWDFSITVSASAGIAAALKSGATSRYARVVYTNGASVQTTFRLQTILKGEAIPQVAKPTGDNLASTDLAVTGKSVLAGRVDGGSSYRNVEIANAAPTAAAIGLITRVAGTPQFLGTVQTHGTSQALGTVQFLAGSVHVAAPISGTVQVHGTVPVQPLAGSVHLATNLAGGTVVSVGSAVHGAVADTRPHLIGVFGSSGTQAAVDDGNAVRLWADLNGRLQVRGTIDSIPSITIGAALPAGDNNIGNVDVVTMPTVTVTGTVQTHGTVSVGTVAGTVSVVGTLQPLAGSVHLASILPGGSVSAQGYVAHDAAVAGNPMLVGGFGSSGTQAAVADGDVVRAWFDLNGRQVVRGTIDSIPNITITAGTVSLNTGGTIHVGTVQRIAGTVDIGTVAGTVAVRTAFPTFGSYFGSAFTAATSNGTLIAPLGQGTRWRLHDVTVSASAAGTVQLTEASSGSVVWGPLFFAANGGMQSNSALGYRARGTNLGLFVTTSAGTTSVTVNYQLETP